MYKLTAQLRGHEDDVRGVVFPNPNLVASVSRDATVRLWKRRDAQSVTFDDHINSTGQAFVNSITFIPPSQKHPNGLIVSGGQDTIIEAREPVAGAQDFNAPPAHVLLGHSHNVCALDNYGDIIVSGSWDGTARVWRNGETQHVLQGHGQTVWAVLALSETEVITGSADKTIRLWRDGKQVKVLGEHTEVVRGLCRLLNGGFASCSNDCTIRLWSAEGHPLQELHGHTSFIYSITVIPTGEIVSSGEDRTVKIWKDGNCIQTITHPAISVWSVAVCSETGDIVTGASDRVVRVFSRDQARWADEEGLKEFDSAVAASSIPATQVGDVDKKDLPGPEALQQQGKKDGQVIMIHNEGNVEAHVWSSQTRSWTNVGSVVDAIGSGRKQLYKGKEYDFVFDVDFQEGAPPLKLPYNASENPFDAARKFLEDNELPMTYLDTVGNFIVTNAKGVELGRGQDRGGPDPWGTENRYRPGETSSPAPRPQPTKKKLVPQTVYLSIVAANLATIQKKVNETNQDLIAKGEKEIALNPDEVSVLAKLIEFLQTAALLNKPVEKPFAATEASLDLLIKIIKSWAPQNQLPGLDLLRLFAAASPQAATYQSSDQKIGEILETSGGFGNGLVNNAMLATRTYVNLFQTVDGRAYMNTRFERTIELVEISSAGTTNRNFKQAKSTLFLNYAVLFHSTSSIDRSIELLKPLTAIIGTETDSEATFRALVALGTLLTLQGDVKAAAVGIYETRRLVSKVESRLPEQRIKDVVAEIKALL
ncbi:WD40-repeat-containing domain protein [Morchella snyderi]|nr:WD40-repeat-containing domain protein [Morchella snyderi]